MELCKDCQKQFDKNDGMLRVFDMCEKCKYKVFLSIKDEDDTIKH